MVVFVRSCMVRTFAAVLFLQLLAQATGVVFAVDELACEEPAGEGSDDCDPGCEDCLCCPHHRALTPRLQSQATLLVARNLVFSRAAVFLSEPEPRDIMHVPKASVSAHSSKRA
jgi:hypothetical protein